MPRPRIYEDLTSTSVKVERRQLQEAIDLGINISELVRDALNNALKTPDTRARKKEAEKKMKGVPVKLKRKAISMVEREMVEDPDFAPGVASHWASEINRVCHTSVEPKDLIDLVPKC